MEKQAQVLTHGHQLVRSLTQESLPLKLCLIDSIFTARHHNYQSPALASGEMHRPPPLQLCSTPNSFAYACDIWRWP